MVARHFHRGIVQLFIQQWCNTESCSDVAVVMSASLSSAACYWYSPSDFF
jgi:hypothetical protein